jgi:light-regulated signal transduction histidine kinase (bacteriophytochrome)
VRKTLVNLNQLVNTAWSDVNLSMSNHAEVTIHSLPSVMADASLLGHVMVNLLSNAIKYSSKNPAPTVDISATAEKNEIVICIKDNGVGFDMNYVHKLFGVFQRLHLESEFEGTGVGLAISQRIIQKHGGLIWATSQVGIGASFYFTLPTVNLENLESPKQNPDRESSLL